MGSFSNGTMMKFLRKWTNSKKRNASDYVDKRPIGVSAEERTKTVEEYVNWMTDFCETIAPGSSYELHS